MENVRLREAAPTSVNVTVGRGKPRLPDRTGGGAAHRGRQAEPLRAPGRHGHRHWLACCWLDPVANRARGSC